MKTDQAKTRKPDQVSKGLFFASLHSVASNVKIAVNVIAIIIISIIVST
jgi:hypothetical protein